MAAAFGKDPGTLTKVSDFRQAGRRTQKTFSPKGGGGGARFRDKFQPSLLTPDTIRIIPGEYPYLHGNADGTVSSLILPYARYGDHFDQKCQIGSICSAGPFAMDRNRRDPCLACDIFWREGGKSGGRMSRRDMYSFSVFNYAVFHEVDQIDKRTGTASINERTGKPWTQWVPCSGRLCDGCAAQKPTKRGHMQHWEMGWGHFSVLQDYANIIGENCKSCLSRNSIRPTAYLCSACKDAVIEIATSTVPDADIAKIIKNKVVCPHCRNEDYLDELSECSGCSTAVPADLWDVDLYLKRTQGTGSQTTLTPTGFGLVLALDPIYEAKPLLLDYTPDTLEKQSEKFREPIPQAKPAGAPAPTSAVARPYGGPPPGAAEPAEPVPARTPVNLAPPPPPPPPPAPPGPPRRGMFG